jgi:tetratricopeptide (TPR) repeat protein
MAASSSRICFTAVLTILFAAPVALAQRPGGPPSTPPPSQTPQPDLNATTPSQPTSTVAPVSKEENKAIKSFRETPTSDAEKKTQLAEQFIDKYPQSRFRPEVVNWLASAYGSKGQVDKLQAEADKEMALKPENPLSLALLGSNMARAINQQTPDAQKRLDQAQQYSQAALDALQKQQKPEGVSEEKFTAAKNETSSIAHSGLGIVAFRKGKYADAVTNLDEAVKTGGDKDPVNWYVLGKANEAQTNFDPALAAYTKCAAISSGMQSACETGIKEMKTHGAAVPK